MAEVGDPYRIDFVIYLCMDKSGKNRCKIVNNKET